MEPSQLALAAVPDAFGEGACALAANIDKAGISGDLVESGQSALRLGQELVVEIGFELQKSVVDAETVILHTAFEQRH